MADSVPSEAKLLEEMKRILASSDLNQLTSKKLRKELEDHFGCKLDSQKDLLKTKTKEYLQGDLEAAEEAPKSKKEEKPKPKRAAKKKPASRKRKARKPTTRTKTRECASAAMCQFMGHDEEKSYELKRTMAFKRVQEYLKEKALSKNSKKAWVLDETLATLFSRKTMTHKQIMKCLSSHFKKYDFEEEIISESEDEVDGEPPKKKKRSGGGLQVPVSLSEPLQAILGPDPLPRTQVIKNLWVYIKDNDLQNPEARREILCDDALKRLFEKDTVTMFEMNKLLSKHLTKM